MNYKELDTQKIKDYIQSHPDGVEVEDIIAHSGAVSGPVRTGAGGMAHGDGTGGAGECEAGEASPLTFLRKIGEEIPEE